jgi:phosphate transport system substrate-binding protein
MAKYFIAPFFLLAFCLLSIPVSAQQLEVPGTGANETILKELALAFNNSNREVEVVIPPSVGSGGGIRLVGTGGFQLGRVARPLKDQEKAYGLGYLVFAKDPVIFVVGYKVGVDTLTAVQLADIYSGKLVNWREAGGNNKHIRLLIREPDDSSLLIIRDKLETFKDLKFSEKAKILFHDYEMVKALNKYSTVIGWLTNASMKNVDPRVKVISIDGIKASSENILNGKYILLSEYAFIYKKGNLTGIAKEFVDFVFSEKGRKILTEAGLVPIERLF